MKKSQLIRIIQESMEPLVRKVVKEEFNNILTELYTPNKEAQVVEEEQIPDVASILGISRTQPSNEPVQEYDNAINASGELNLETIMKETKPFSADQMDKGQAASVNPPNLSLGQANTPHAAPPTTTPISLNTTPSADPEQKEVPGGLKPVAGAAKQKVDEAIDADPSLKKGEKLVLKALTKDYSGVIKHLNKTKGAARKPAFQYR